MCGLFKWLIKLLKHKMVFKIYTILKMSLRYFILQNITLNSILQLTSFCFYLSTHSTNILRTTLCSDLQYLNISQTTIATIS